MSDILNDLRFGLRMLRKRPGTSVLAVVALGLGIGLTTTMFSIVQGVVLRGLPFEESERIIHLGRVTIGQASVQGAPMHDFIDWRASQQSFEELSAFTNASATITGGLAPQRYRLARVTTNTLHLLRVTPAIGRGFTEADGTPGAASVVLISDEIWTSQFKRDPGVINLLVRVNGAPATIVGVMPPRFGFPNAQQVWMPLQIVLPETRGVGTRLEVIGRLKPRVPITQAAAEFDTIGRRLSETYPENKDAGIRLTPYVRRFIGQQVIDTLFTMLGAVFGVMLIACTNVANLQLARAAERTREVALRMALGARRGRVVRQLLLESGMLAVTGALLGLAVASTAIALFNRGIADTAPPFWIDIKLDRTVLAFVTALTAISALAASLVPALRATRQDLNAVLKDEGRGNTGLHMGRFSRGLVVVEVLLSCTLLIVSGFMIKGVIASGRIQYPYATADVFIARLTAPETKYVGEAATGNLAERVEMALKTLPGLTEVSLSSGTPENTGSASVAVDGVSYNSPTDQPRVRRLAVSVRFFDVLRVRPIAGRLFSNLDSSTTTPVAIVGQDFAEKLVPGTTALGRRIRFGTDAGAPWLTIVGIVPKLASARTRGATEIAYIPLAQSPELGWTVLASTSLNPVVITSGIRSAILRVDEDMALDSPNSLATEYRQSSWPIRVFGSLFTSFGVAALLLASAGLYGVMAFSVRRRTNEIGVRMALGADRATIVRMVLAQGMWRTGLGVALGLGPAWLLGGAMVEPFNVSPADPLVVSVATMGLLSAGFLASLVPALRAASVDPLVALRTD